MLLLLILIIFGFLILLGLAFWLALPIAGLAVLGQRWAKKQARHMLDTGEVEWKNFDRVSKILATTRDDLEAADLWHRLQELRDKQIGVKSIP